MDRDDQLTTGCPKCGSPLAGRETECPACGVVIAKARTGPARRPPRPTPPPASQPSGVSPATLHYLQGTAAWVHGIAFATLLAGALYLVGSLFLMWVSTGVLRESAEVAVMGLATSATSLPLAVVTIFIGVRLSRFAGALSPRGRRLRDADLQSAVELHTRLWWWVIGVLIAYLIASLLVGLMTPPSGRPTAGGSRRAVGAAQRGANSASWAMPPRTRFEPPTPSSRTGRRPASLWRSSRRATSASSAASAVGSARVRDRVTVVKSP